MRANVVKVSRPVFRDAVQRGIEARSRALANLLAPLLRRHAKAVLEREAAAHVRRSVLKREVPIDQLPDEIRRVVEIYGVRQMQDAAGRAGSSWAVRPTAIRDFMANKDVMIQGLLADVEERVRNGVRQIIAAALEEQPQPSAGAVMRRIAHEYGDELSTDARGRSFDPYSRAQTIARTELAQAENTGIVEGYVATGVDQLEWLAYTDGLSGNRHHERLNGIRVKLGAYFETPLGNSLRYPCDPLGAIEDTANCRCTVAPVRRHPTPT